MNDQELYYEYLECDCGAPECVLRVVLDRETFPCKPEIYLGAQLNPYLPFYRRVWYGLIYIFTGKPQHTNSWVSTILSEDSINKLSKIIVSYRFIKKLRTSKIKKQKLSEGRE